MSLPPPQPKVTRASGELRDASDDPRAAPWADRLIGADPGFNRLRSAVLSVVTIALILLAETLFVRLTHALQVPGVAHLPAAEAAKAAAANHEYLVVMMMLGAMVGMISSFGVSDPKAKGQLVSMLFLPFPMVGALALGLSLGSHRLLCLILLPVITAVGTYCRRFGPRGMLAGILLFMGFFLGFFLHAALTLHDTGWLLAAIGVGLGVAMAVRFLLFFPDQRKALRRVERSFVVRARQATGMLVELFDTPLHDPRTTRRLQTLLLRLNETALMFDALLVDPAAVQDGSSRQSLHERIFDLELALTNVVRFTQVLARLPLADAQRSEVRLALFEIGRRDPAAAKRHAENLGQLLEHDDANWSFADPSATPVVVLHRFVRSMIALADAGTNWLSSEGPSLGSDEFESSIVLFGGWLPGSAGVSSMASTESGYRVGDRVRLQPWTRAAIQLGVAMGVATYLGDLISPSRYYWAVIAVFITFMGVNNSGEQTRKALYRVVGTGVGIGIGSLVVDAVGHHTDWSIAVIIVSLFFGFYLMRINYTFMVIAVTVMVSQLYQELYEFSNALLLYRLAETALGAAVAIVVVSLLFPLRTRRVLRVAFRSHVQAIEVLVDHASEVLISEGVSPADDRLRKDARAVDASYQALVATAQPLRRDTLGRIDAEVEFVVHLASSSRNHVRDLVIDLSEPVSLSPSLEGEVRRASATLHQSMDTVANAVTGPREGVYVRSSSLFDRCGHTVAEGVAGIDQGGLVLQDLKLVDATMARLAEFIGLEVEDLRPSDVA